MAEDRFSVPSASFRSALPAWTEIFRTFRIALDPKKLVIAAVGILVMWAGWWLISWVCYELQSQPKQTDYPVVKSFADMRNDYPREQYSDEDVLRKRLEENSKRSRRFNQDSDHWLELHRFAGRADSPATVDYLDDEGKPSGVKKHVWGGRFRQMPWHESRGPNPYLLVTGQTDRPWETGHFVEWFLTDEVPVLVEPLVKFLEPIVRVLDPKTSLFVRVYLILIILWTLATWALFGGMITRMAVVEMAGKDPLTFKEAFQFVKSRYASYFSSPLVPLGLIGVLVLVAVVFGLIHLIPFVGDVVSGILWPFVLLLGLGMALLLVGLVGFPLMYPTISAEGSDTLDALSRSYNYVYQSPWSYLWYVVVMIFYGAVVTFFVGFLGSLTVYLGKWGISQLTENTWSARNPEYLMIKTPTSFGWRSMLLRGSPGEGVTAMEEERQRLLRRGVDPMEYEAGLPAEQRAIRAAAQDGAEKSYAQWRSTYYWYNELAAWLVGIWITALFLMILGFGYSFFWCGSTVIYLLMRKRVDDTDLDEVYLEESELPDPFAGPTTPMPPAAPTPAQPVMVEAPTLRSDKAPSSTPPAAPPAADEPPPGEPPPPPPTGP